MNIFIIYVLSLSIVIALIFSKKFRAFFLCVIVFASFLYGAFALQNVALAEEETRTCFIVGFDLEKGVFILEDEDGYLWGFDLMFDAYTVGDEYILHLLENKEPWIEEV